MHDVHSRARLFFVTALAGASVAILVLARPSFPAGSWSRGDDVALAAAWAVAVAASTWLFAASAACLLALGVRRPHLARAFARALPPTLRRSVEVAIVASCLAVSAAPAHAANSGAGAVIDQPVVRGFRSLAVPPSTVFHAAPRSTPATPRTTTAAPAPSPSPSSRPSPSSLPSPSSRPAPRPSITPAPAPRFAPTGEHTRASAVPAPSSSPTSTPSPHNARVVVRPGDNLWLIARTELIRSTGAYPSDGAVARYWRAVIDANRTTLRSGDPSLIFPGEIVALPPVRSVS